MNSRKVELYPKKLFKITQEHLSKYSLNIVAFSVSYFFSRKIFMNYMNYMNWKYMKHMNSKYPSQLQKLLKMLFQNTNLEKF